MDIEKTLQKKVDKSLQLAEENNKILKKIRRSMVLGRVVSVLYWMFIIGTAVGAYYFIQPFLESFKGVFSGLSDIPSLLDFKQ